MLPNFLIIGSMKAGTTSLYRYLGEHPQVYVSEKKELNYFSTGIDGGVSRDEYEACFDAGTGARALGEASVSYSKFPVHPRVASRIAEQLPEVRLIYVIRHPIDRMRSQWMHMSANGEEVRPMADALLEDSRYVDFSSYALQLEQYLSYFPRDQILVLTSEDLRDARRETLKRVFEFLDIDRNWWGPELEVEYHPSAPKRRPSSLTRRLRHLGAYRALAGRAPAFARKVNRAALSRPMTVATTNLPADVRRQLESLLRDDLLALKGILGVGFDAWGLVPETESQP